MKPPVAVFIPCLLLIVFFSACSGDGDKGPAFEVAAPELKAVGSKEARLVKTPDAPLSQSLQERKLIRNGTIEFEVDDVKKTKADITAICNELNAYSSNESENNYGDRLVFQLTIRVPAQKFDDLLNRLEGLAEKVENKNITTDDVTEEFIDVEARMHTKKQLEVRYLEILKQARSVEDILSVESQLANVRSEIESMEGRLKFLKNQVAFSTLHLSFYETIGTDFAFFSKFGRSIIKGWENLLSFIIFLFTLWPFAIAVGVASFWWMRKKRARQAE
jgi:hypothetical protein